MVKSKMETVPEEPGPDPIELLEFQLSLTPETQSASPDALDAFHIWCRASLNPETTIVDHNEVMAETASRPLLQSLVLAELLMALGQFETAVAVGQQLFDAHPMDHRVQDALFRARYYRQIGHVHEHPGLELHGKVCPILWDTLHLLPAGHVHQCCSVWLRTPIGNVFAEPPMEIWHSDAAEKVRQSAIDGDYRYCGKLSCPSIQRALFPPEDDSTPNVFSLDGPSFIALDQVPQELQPPKRLNLSYDKTCNLSCPSCRTTKIAAKGAAFERIEKVTDAMLSLLKDAETMEVTGSGDPFASKSFRRILASINRGDYPSLRIFIMTNGQLLRRSEWGKFEHLHGMIDVIHLSVDATRPDTYEIVRRGGRLEDLLPNLEFIGELTAQGAIRHYRLCFVVQDYNFREMHEFVELANRVGANAVHFQMMHDWGTYTKEELAKRRVHLTSHPDHAEFLQILKSLPRPNGLKILSDFSYMT